MSAPTVLLYAMSRERSRSIKLLCLAQKLRVKEVAPAEYGLTLNDLLDGKAPEEGEEASPLSQEMMVMAGLSGAQMNRFLVEFRRKKLPPVALKAVLTATNAGWDSHRLYEELQAEHEAVQQGKQAHEAKGREQP